MTITRRSVGLITALILTSTLTFAQGVRPAPTLLMLNAGYGAAALGMGGAFTAVANDLSAIYWNPAGVGQLSGIQFAVDYSFGLDSGEDFSPEAIPSRFDSAQRFELKGNEFRSFAVSYAYDTRQYRFVPFFAWHKTTHSFSERTLKAPVEVVSFLTPRTFLQSEGTFTENVDGDEEEYAFGMSAMVTGKILVGASMSILAGSPETVFSGVFTDSLVSDTGTVTSNVVTTQTTNEDLSGGYLKVGLLFYPTGPFRVGGSMRFPYSRSSDINVRRVSTLTTNGVPTQLEQVASAETEVEAPFEWSAGIATHSAGATATASMTYADWSETVQTVTRSTDLALLPESALLYPTLRPTLVQQSLLQFRVGTEYAPKSGQAGLIIRGGYFWDGQPYGTERKYLTGYSVGAGYMTRSFRIDGAYIKQSGDVRLTSFSSQESSMSHTRFLVSVSLLSPE